LGQKPVIALIDDDPAVRESMRALLHSSGYATRGYKSAEDFLMSPELETIDCIITDIRMPGMSGVELADRLRGTGWRVILISAFLEEEVAARAVVAGAHAVLKKPCSQETLLHHVRSALSNEAPRRP
jgi:FixJ family two-component response regulator